MSEPDNRYGYLGLKDGRGYILPMSGKVATRALDVYSAQTLKAKAGKWLLAFALKLGAGPYVLPRVVIANGAKNAELLDHLQQVLSQPELSFAISLGVPGPHRKPVLQAITPNGVTIAFIKVGWNTASNALVQREADTLRMLHRISPSTFVTPEVIYAREWHGRFICIQSAPEKSTPPPLTFSTVHRDIIRTMADHSPVEQLLDSSSFWQTLQMRVTQVANRYYRGLLENGMTQARQLIGNQCIPFHFCHGDFTPWNCKQVETKLLLYDWEYASTEHPAGWDIIRFFVQTQYFVEKRSPGDIISSFQENGPAGRALSDHLRYLGADSGLAGKLVGLYLLDQLAFYAAENPAGTHTLRFLAALLNLFMLRPPHVTAA